ncbi:DNA integrity scanning diadenylate cyclase DisA [Candidatus Oleimmundimicrobium sp.]|uniref:DNA integrity scanning diadenylate cyclase DisA n=1 Tax=Candidatus Oleimmundimicrobium sp. TaxID=3060597 RepID=UPI00271741FC|nr:DNA integrity scanning diadenylate cyclase DisA [Candidatus Oleimmundimicrobium sp.]MDO8885982.1 DNA integrity scanning diadenylate cyclase DisA [Candidatus Oleimmundimicrobium sp.]
MSEKKKTTLINVLKIVAPGTPIRDALEQIISGRTGALIVIGDVEEVEKLCDGGFELNVELHPQKLFELSKMDGAIILDQDLKKILGANIHLVPDPMLSTDETGMRHRTAERVAKQTNALVVSISQRRDVISLYWSNYKYVLEDIRALLAKANQALQTLEKYKIRLNEVSTNLNSLEFQDFVTLLDVGSIIQRFEMVKRVADEVERYIIELGSEGRLIKMQLEELMVRVEEDNMMVLKDYCKDSRRAEKAAKELRRLSSEELLDLTNICRILGYEGDTVNILDKIVHPKGYRLLRKIPRLPVTIVNKIIKKFGDLETIIKASIEDLDEVEGIGEVRAKAIWEGLKRLRGHSTLEQYI